MIRAATNRFADVVICGAGITGISTAYYLASRHGLKNIVIVDPRPPLSLTSAVSTECFRDFWPRKTMHEFNVRSIELMKEFYELSGKAFTMNMNGYLFYSKERDISLKMKNWLHYDHLVQKSHSGNDFRFDPDRIYGVDIFTDPHSIQKTFPYLSESVQSAVMPRNCGWMNAHTMGMELFDKAMATGCVSFVKGKIMHSTVDQGTISSLGVQYDSGLFDYINCGAIVNAAGPYMEEVDMILTGQYDEEGRIPLKNTPHAKVMMKDPLNVLPGNAPVLIHNDDITLNWSEEERCMIEELSDKPLKRILLETLPGGAHVRKSGQDSLIFVWEHGHPTTDGDGSTSFTPQEEMQFHHMYPEICLRSLMGTIPALQPYAENMPKSTYIDGGYYTHTPDNMPLIGRKTHRDHGLYNYFLGGGMSGYGVMASHAVGELLSDLVCHADMSSVPASSGYAKAFSPLRFYSPEHNKRNGGDDEKELIGQI